MSDAAVEKVTRTLSGTVVSNKMDKTITVQVVRQVKHPVYGKYIRRSSKLHAHDENNQCNIGDKVTVQTSRPISKLKSWVLQSIDEESSAV
jgi:small subunit ribosomal protein S17